MNSSLKPTFNGRGFSSSSMTGLFAASSGKSCRLLSRVEGAAQRRELTRQLAIERERADYAWRNTRTIEAARQEEMRKRDAAEAEAERLRGLLSALTAVLGGVPLRLKSQQISIFDISVQLSLFPIGKYPLIFEGQSRPEILSGSTVIPGQTLMDEQKHVD